ncbi:MAG: sigma-70 family RNA polymerase sigma factor [Planctomycetota bacterium]
MDGLDISRVGCTAGGDAARGFAPFSLAGLLASTPAILDHHGPRRDHALERKVFEDLSLPHLNAVYRMAMQLARHPDEAADLVQETYLRALRVAERYEERGGGIRPWLFKILHNVFYTRAGRAKRQPIGVEDFPTAATDEPGPDEPPPAWDLASLEWEHVDERLKASIEQLRPEYRSVLLLWGVEGLKYREIAEIQEIPIGTVMSRLHRARSMLARQLSEIAEEKGILPR